MFISAPHPVISQPKTYLTAEAAAAATALTVANNAQFAANDYIVKGTPAQENTELKKISTVSGSATINIVGDALAFAASINTPITFIKYNKVRFYLGDWSARYTTGTLAVEKGSRVVTGSGTTWTSVDTTYALLLNGKWYDIKSVDSDTQITLTDDYQEEELVSSTYAMVPFTDQTSGGVAIAIDQPETLWDDTDALAEDYYRTDYYNSTTTFSSAKSSIISAAELMGFSEFSRVALEDEILESLNDEDGERYSRNSIDRNLNDCLRILTNTIIASVDEDYLNSFTTIDFSANAFEYPLPTDFRKLGSLWVAYDGVNYLKAKRLKINDDLPNISYLQDYPMYYLRDNRIGIKPTPTAAATDGIKMWYERRIPSFKNDGDEIPYMLRDFKHLFVAYSLWKQLLSDDKPKAEGYKQEFSDGRFDLATTLADRDRGENDGVEIANDEDLYD